MSEHPQFSEFRDRALADPAVHAAYEAAQAREEGAIPVLTEDDTPIGTLTSFGTTGESDVTVHLYLDDYGLVTFALPRDELLEVLGR